MTAIDQGIGIADKGVDLIHKIDTMVSKKLDSHYNAVAKKLDPLIKSGEIFKSGRLSVVETPDKTRSLCVVGIT